MFNNCIVFLCVIIACYAMAVNIAIHFVKRQKINLVQNVRGLKMSALTYFPGQLPAKYFRH